MNLHQPSCPPPGLGPCLLHWAPLCPPGWPSKAPGLGTLQSQEAPCAHTPRAHPGMEAHLILLHMAWLLNFSWQPRREVSSPPVHRWGSLPCAVRAALHRVPPVTTPFLLQDQVRRQECKSPRRGGDLLAEKLDSASPQTSAELGLFSILRAPRRQYSEGSSGGLPSTYPLSRAFKALRYFLSYKKRQAGD